MSNQGYAGQTAPQYAGQQQQYGQPQQQYPQQQYHQQQPQYAPQQYPPQQQYPAQQQQYVAQEQPPYTGQPQYAQQQPQYAQQPPPPQYYPPGSGPQHNGAPQPQYNVRGPNGVILKPDFKYPICSATDDCGLCCLATFCPCIVHNEIEELRDGRSNAFANCLCCVLPYVNLCYFCIMLPQSRGKTRQHLQIQPDGFQDWVCNVFCRCCPLTQELRELREMYPMGNPMYANGPPQQYMGNAPMQGQAYGQPQNSQSYEQSPPVYDGQPQQNATAYEGTPAKTV